MLLDDKSEIIAHFIGLLDLKTDAARLRAEYEEFVALHNANPELGGLLNVTVNMTSDYALGEYYGYLNNPFFLSASAGTGSASSFQFSPNVPKAYWFGDAGLPPPALPFALQPLANYSFDLEFYVPPPSSVATVTLQSNVLMDQDAIWGPDAYDGFYSPEHFNPALLDLVGRADALQVIEVPGLPEDEAAIAEAGGDIAARVQSLRETQSEDSAIPVAASVAVAGASIHMAFGSDTDGTTLNGTQVDELPQLADYSKRIDAETGEREPGPFEDDETGHEILTGGNDLINEANIVTSWLDAPVMVVMQDMISVNVVSQINVWNDHNTGNWGSSSASGAGTQGVNASAFSMTSNPIVVAEDASGPQYIAMTTIEGNLLNFNHLQQFNFAGDNDMMSVDFTAQETLIQAGDGTLFNLAGLLELGFNYNLIVIGGSLIDVSFISQMNVLLDADRVEVEGQFDGSVANSGNLLFNGASISQVGIDEALPMIDLYHSVGTSLEAGGGVTPAVMGDPDFLGTDVMSVLYIMGDYLDMQVIHQVNVLGDADQVALAAQTAQSAEGANVSVNTGDNELINVASVTDYGIDSTIYVEGETYSDAMLYQAEFISADDPLMVQDMGTLATEAVLFLADDMLTSDGAGGEGAVPTGVVTPTPQEAPADVMQSVLA